MLLSDNLAACCFPLPHDQSLPFFSYGFQQPHSIGFISNAADSTVCGLLLRAKQQSYGFIGRMLLGRPSAASDARALY